MSQPPKEQNVAHTINSKIENFVVALTSAGTAVIFIPSIIDESSVALLRNLKSNQQRLHYLHVAIVCITASSTQDINQLKINKDIVFPILNQDAIEYARRFGTVKEEKIECSALLRKKYSSFNASGLAETIVRDAAVMVDLDAVSLEESIAEEEDPIVVFYPDNVEINARGMAGVADLPAPHQNPANGGGVVRTWVQVDAEIQNNGGAANNPVGERVANAIPGCWMYRFNTPADIFEVLQRLKATVPWTKDIIGRVTVAHYVVISIASVSQHRSKLSTVVCDL